MADSVGALAKDIKRFLKTAAEDILPAVSACVPQTSAVTQVSEPIPVQEMQTVPLATAASVQSAVGANPVAGPVLEVTFPRAEKDIPTQEVAMNTAQKTAALQELAETIKNCQRCPLGATRIHAVPGEGNVNATVLFVGEGPGFEEDRQARPFVGRAGQLLTKMILAMGLTREEVYIANIAKCHPMTDPLHPEKHNNDRAPNAQEIACCRKYIEQQISIILPKYVIALGSVAAKALISDAGSLGALRGKFHRLHLDSVELKKPVEIIATYHPAALLRNPNWKKDAWADLQLVMDKLGLKGARK